MKHFILGTAGHVDHGKSSLIKALTNVDTDRLPEEKERGLSIDLGFAPLLLENSKEDIQLGVVDVPGHHRFLRNMIAGVGGFDAALLVVDCCEGVKPQTEEHLKILQLLQTRAGVVALSKADKSDEDGLEIAQWELRELLQGTFLEDAPIVATSAQTGQGLDELRSHLYQMFEKLPERNAQGVARLPVDRAFSKVGFGDVVTGSLWSGSLSVGDEVEFLPLGAKGKVRGLQVHGEAVESALPGQRVAVNVSGLDKADLKRGETLVSPVGSLVAAEAFAVSLTLKNDDPKWLKKKFKGTFFQGTSHYQLSVNLVAEKPSDTEVFGQLRFREPVLLCRGDRFLLRDETDSQLIGGGTVLGSEERPFRRSRAAAHLKRYQALSGGGEVGRVCQFLMEKGGFAKESALRKHQGLSPQEWEKQLELLLDSGRVVRLGKDKLWDTETLESLSSKVHELLVRLVEAAPWKGGWPPQDIINLLGLKSGSDQGLGDVLDRMVSEGQLQRNGPLYAPAGHEPKLGPAARKSAQRVVELLEGDLYSPRDWEHCVAEVAPHDRKLQSQIEDFLFGTRQVVRLSEKIVTTPNVLEKARDVLTSSSEDGFTASEARQFLDTSRKFIIPILEWMDNEGWTVRLGDKRKMAPR